MGVWVIFYVGSDLELKHMDKGKIELFFTCSTGLRPALLLGWQGLEGPAQWLRFL